MNKRTVDWKTSQELRKLPVTSYLKSQVQISILSRVAELGSLSSGAKMAMKIFVKRVFTIFASNASFLRIIANCKSLPFFYFLTFEKGRLLYIHPVGRLVGWLVDVTINFFNI